MSVNFEALAPLGHSFDAFDGASKEVAVVLLNNRRNRRVTSCPSGEYDLKLWLRRIASVVLKRVDE